MHTLENLPHTLYRFHDAAGRLLYIGIAVDFLQRWRKHRRREWWSQVARMDIEQYPSRSAALAAERQAIIIEKPQYNHQHNKAVWGGGRPSFLERWEAWKDAYVTSPWPHTSTTIRLARLTFLALQLSGTWGFCTSMSVAFAPVGHPLLAGYLAFMLAMAGIGFFVTKMVGGLEGQLFGRPRLARPPGCWRRRVLLAVLFIR
jgi:predicted GIY-YIG superfamily endonuclease